MQTRWTPHNLLLHRYAVYDSHCATSTFVPIPVTTSLPPAGFLSMSVMQSTFSFSYYKDRPPMLMLPSHENAIQDKTNAP